MDANKDIEPKSAPTPVVDDVRPAQPTAGEVATAPPEQSDVSADSVAGAMAAGDMNTAPEAPEAENPMAITNPPQKHPMPKGPVVVALAIAVLLAVLAVMVFIKTNKADAPSGPATSNNSTTPVTAGDVDQTTQDIDADMKTVDEATDFGENDLSDSKLEL